MAQEISTQDRSPYRNADPSYQSPFSMTSSHRRTTYSGEYVVVRPLRGLN
jgi:hypothetical protein